MSEHKTQSKPEIYKPNDKKTATAMYYHSSSLDLCVQKIFGMDMVRIYVRPTNLDVSNLIDKGIDVKSFIFDRVDIETPSEKVLKILTPLKPLYKDSFVDAIIYSYGLDHKKEIYKSVSCIK